MVPFIWTDQCQKAFQILKGTLIKSPIVVYQDLNRPYTLFMVASKDGWSTVLTQESKYF